MAEVFANPLVDLAEYTDMKQDLDKGKGPVQISGVTDSQKVHVMYELSKDNPWRLVVTYDDTRAKEIFDDFSYFEPNTWLYPARDLLFYSSDIHGNLLTRQRMQVFKHLLEDEGGVVVTTVDGLMDHLLPLSMIKESCLNIMVGQTLDMEEIKHLLTGMGYERMGQVDGMGQFSVRGGILDVFPLTEEVPVRIELLGGGGNGILKILDNMQVPLEHIHHIFVTHAHTDHVLGIVWMVRMIATKMKKDQYVGDAYIYCHSELIETIRTLCRLTIQDKFYNMIGNRIHLEEVKDGETRHILSYDVTFFDIHSTKLKQFGFTLTLNNGRKLTCAGDEPYNPVCEKYVRGSDWLLHEAFCLYAERSRSITNIS